MEELRPRPQRSVSARSARHHGTTGHRVVQMARMGLHAEEGDNDDQAIPKATQLRHDSVVIEFLSVSSSSSSSLILLLFLTAALNSDTQGHSHSFDSRPLSPQDFLQEPCRIPAGKYCRIPAGTLQGSAVFLQVFKSCRIPAEFYTAGILQGFIPQLKKSF